MYYKELKGCYGFFFKNCFVKILKIDKKLLNGILLWIFWGSLCDEDNES